MVDKNKKEHNLSMTSEDIQEIKKAKESELEEKLKKNLNAVLKKNQEEAIEYGFFWGFKGIMFFNSHYGKCGFNKEEVAEIYPQIEKQADYSMDNIDSQHVLIKLKEEKFYVYIDDLGDVYLPELIGSDSSRYNSRIYGKTKEPEKILHFRTNENWKRKGPRKR